MVAGWQRAIRPRAPSAYSYTSAVPVEGFALGAVLDVGANNFVTYGANGQLPKSCTYLSVANAPSGRNIATNTNRTILTSNFVMTLHPSPTLGLLRLRATSRTVPENRWPAEHTRRSNARYSILELGSERQNPQRHSEYHS